MSQSLEQRIARLEAVQAVQNVMSTYEYLHSAYRNADIVELFADRDDTVIDMPFGKWYGPDAARRCFGVIFKEDLTPRDLSGEYVEHLLTTPIIEVAGDGETAKAVWSSPGLETHKFFWVEGSPRYTFWYWCRYSVDFIKTDKGWKIWHLRVHQTWAADYYKSFTDGPQPPEPPAPGTGPAKFDEPPQESTSWRIDRAPQLIPVPPVPYETSESDEPAV